MTANNEVKYTTDALLFSDRMMDLFSDLVKVIAVKTAVKEGRKLISRKDMEKAFLKGLDDIEVEVILSRNVVKTIQFLIKHYSKESK